MLASRVENECFEPRFSDLTRGALPSQTKRADAQARCHFLALDISRPSIAFSLGSLGRAFSGISRFALVGDDAPTSIVRHHGHGNCPPLKSSHRHNLGALRRPDSLWAVASPRLRHFGTIDQSQE